MRSSSRSSAASRRGSPGPDGRGSECRCCSLAAALAAGALALLADGLGANSQDVLFSGQASLPALVTEESTRIVLVLIAAKGLAYAVCLGCGFRGGPVFPAIFLGVALTTLAAIAFDMSPTLAVAVGTAAGTGGDDAPALRIGPLRRAPRRHGGPRHRPRGVAGGRRGVVDDGRDRRAVPGATLALGRPWPSRRGCPNRPPRPRARRSERTTDATRSSRRRALRPGGTPSRARAGSAGRTRNVADEAEVGERVHPHHHQVVALAEDVLVDLLRPLRRDEQVEAELATLGGDPDCMLGHERRDGVVRCLRANVVRLIDHDEHGLAVGAAPPERCEYRLRATACSSRVEVSRDRRRDNVRRAVRCRRRAIPPCRAPTAASSAPRGSPLGAVAPAHAARATSRALRR